MIEENIMRKYIKPQLVHFALLENIVLSESGNHDLELDMEGNEQ